MQDGQFSPALGASVKLIGPLIMQKIMLPALLIMEKRKRLRESKQ